MVLQPGQKEAAFATQVETKPLGTELVDKPEWSVNTSPWNPKQTYQKEGKNPFRSIFTQPLTDDFKTPEQNEPSMQI